MFFVALHYISPLLARNETCDSSRRISLIGVKRTEMLLCGNACY